MGPDLFDAGAQEVGVGLVKRVHLNTIHRISIERRYRCVEIRFPGREKTHGAPTDCTTGWGLCRAIIVPWLLLCRHPAKMHMEIRSSIQVALDVI